MVVYCVHATGNCIPGCKLINALTAFDNEFRQQVITNDNEKRRGHRRVKVRAIFGRAHSVNTGARSPHYGRNYGTGKQNFCHL